MQCKIHNLTYRYHVSRSSQNENGNVNNQEAIRTLAENKYTGLIFRKLLSSLSAYVKYS